MTNVYAFFAPRSVIRASLMHDDLHLLSIAKEHAGDYEPVQGLTLPQKGEAAAEELFDLTNNPSRDEDREYYLWDRKPISVGDIVQVGRTQYLCSSFGWLKVPKDAMVTV
jgi:hypothetical protein